MRIALAQINPTVGDLTGNVNRMTRAARDAAGRGAEAVVFPELSLAGYPPRDLVEKPSFLDASARELERLAAETTDLAGVLATARGALLIDGIGGWLAAVLDERGAWDNPGTASEKLAGPIAELIGAWRQTTAYIVAVSEETGLGVVPATPAGRLFRDELGRLNQALAAESEEAELVVAGRVLPLETR